jgi:YD repeat-containing protein
VGYDAKYGTDSLYSGDYTHDALGRIIQKTEMVQGLTSIYAYGYDLAGRLTEVKREGMVVSTYTYDANGNRTHVNGILVGQYDDQDRLIHYNGITYSYTANGELLSKTNGGGTTQYAYDVLGNAAGDAPLGHGHRVCDRWTESPDREEGQWRLGAGLLVSGSIEADCGVGWE